MPAVRFENGWCGVVTGDQQHLRIELIKIFDPLIHFFDNFHLGIEITIFTVTIRLFKMNKEEIILIIIFF